MHGRPRLKQKDLDPERVRAAEEKASDGSYNLYTARSMTDVDTDKYVHLNLALFLVRRRVLSLVSS